ncbi:MAG: hypothetical protein WA003_12485 [Desulfuromonadaceae bacterium]
MRIVKLAAFGLILLLAACAKNRVAVDNAGNGEYVEIDNPAYTMSPGAPATIWVPRKSVDNGVPRGGEVLKKGYDSVVSETKGNPQQWSSEKGQSGTDYPREQYRENQFR